MSAGLILLSGRVGVGKTSVGLAMTASLGAALFSTSQAIANRLPDTPLARLAFQQAGESLDASTHGRWVAEELVSSLENSPNWLIVDAIRTRNQILAIRESVCRSILHVHLIASARARRARYLEKISVLQEVEDYALLECNATESQVDRLGEVADIVLDTTSISIKSAADHIAKLALLRTDVPA